MKYYSDVTKKLYDSESALNAAELAESKRKEEEKLTKEKAAAERKARAGEVEAARKAMVAAQSKYRELLEAFCKDYGTYHYSTDSASEIPSLFDIFEHFRFL